MSHSQILHLDLDAFLVAVERKYDPSLRGRALVIGGQPTGWGRVVAMSEEAARRGVKLGLSLAVAASRCPEAVFLDGAFDRYLDQSAAIDEILREPGVPVEWTSIDSVFLDLTGSAARLGPARKVAERIQAALREDLHFDASCGLASTKIAAQVASGLARPRGLLCVLPGYEERFLASLDVHVLPDLPPGATVKLHQAGVITLADLARMPLDTAEEILGRRFREFLHLARGLDERVVDGTAPPRSMAREITLPSPTDDPDALEAATQYLTETLASRLRRMGCFAHTVTLRVRSSSADRSQARSTTLREGTAIDSDLVAAAQALLRVIRRSCRGITGVSVVLSNLQNGGAQMPLFPLSTQTSAGVSTGTDRWASLRGRAGFRALVSGRFLDSQVARTRKAG